MKSVNKKILAIDDINDNLIVLKALIIEAFPDIEFLGASSGAEGLKLCHEEKPDIILLDVVMPAMDGYEVCKVIKSDPSLRSLPVVMITATKTNRESKIRSLECGADAFLTKPIDESELTAQIRAMLRIKEAEDTIQFEKAQLEELVRKRTEELERELIQRKNAEDAIRRAERYFRTLIEKAPDGIVLIGPDRKFNYASPSARKMFGYSETESVFPTPDELTHPDDLPIVLETLENLIKDPTLIPNLEYRFRKKNGDWLWVESTFSNQLAEPGVEGIVINFRNITKRKKIEEVQQFLLSAGWTNSGEDFFHCLADYLAESLSMNYVRISRLLSDDQDSQTLAVYSDQVLPDQVVALFEELSGSEVVGKNICFFEYNLRDFFPDNAVIKAIQAECYVGATLWSSDGKPIGLIELMSTQPMENSSMVGSVLNLVTLRAAGELERQEAELALYQSRKAFQNYFQNCSVGMSVTSPEKNWLEVNDRLCQMLGYSKEELVTLNWVDVTYHDDIDLNLKMFGELTAGKVDRYELDKRFVRKDGSLLYTTLSTVCERNPDGSVHHLLSSYVDVTARHLAEEAIRQERSLLRTLIDNLPDIIYVKDSQCRKIVANKADLKRMGYTSESDIIGKTSVEIFSPANGQRGYLEDLAVIQTGIPLVNREKSFLDSDGKRHWRLTSKFPFYDESHHVQGLVGIGYDITERKLIEEALKESEKLYRNLIEKMPDGVYKSTHAGKFVSVNPALVTMLGYESTEELMAIDIEKELYFEPEDRHQQICDEIEGGFDVYQLKKKDGSCIWVEDHSWYNRDEKGDILYHEGILRDITDRKKVEDKLRILSRAIEQNPASTVITDAKGKIEFVNRAFTTLTQYQMKEVLNRLPRIFASGHTPQAEFESMWETLLKGNIWKGEYKNRRKDQSKYWEDVTISPLMTNGKISNFILIMDDISEKKRIVNDLIAAKERAEESNRLKSAFLALMNHELRTPLNHILGFSELIMSGIAPDDNVSFASSIQTSGQNLLSIIEGVFDMALVEQANIKLRKQTFSLMDHFMENKASIDSILRTSAKQDQIQLIFKPDTRWLSSYITADRSKINQVLTNLFKNAVKFTHKGVIEFGCKIKNESVLVFYVKDTGIGIPKEKQGIIFDFFRQGDDSYTRVYGGIGIGLAISKKITNILEGELTVVSEPDQGSIFSLSLPVELSESKE